MRKDPIYGHRERHFGPASRGASPAGDFSRDGLVDELKKVLSERILNAELDEHLDDQPPSGAPKHQAPEKEDRLDAPGPTSGTHIMRFLRVFTSDPLSGEGSDLSHFCTTAYKVAKRQSS